MAKLIGNVASFDITEVAHPAHEFLAIWIVLQSSSSDVSDARGLPRLLRARRERPRHRCAAEQREELASAWVEHGLLPGTRSDSLPQAKDAPEAPAGPWRRPEMF